MAAVDNTSPNTKSLMPTNLGLLTSGASARSGHFWHRRCCYGAAVSLGKIFNPRKHTSDKLSITYDRFCKTDFVKFVQVLESRHCERPAVCELMIFERRHCCAFLSETVAVVLGHYCCSAVIQYNHCTTMLCCN